MRMRTSLTLVLSLGLAGIVPGAATAEASDAAAPGIQWYATWKQARAEAKRLNRPILLTSAVPHCRNVSGLW